MRSPWGKLTTLACHLTKNVNIAEELTYSLQTLVVRTQNKAGGLTRQVGRQSCQAVKAVGPGE
jgi:hypothetical protein